MRLCSCFEDLGDCDRQSGTVSRLRTILPLSRLPQSLESVERISRLKRRFGGIDVREYLFGDYHDSLWRRG